MAYLTLHRIIAMSTKPYKELREKMRGQEEFSVEFEFFTTGSRLAWNQLLLFLQTPI